MTPLVPTDSFAEDEASSKPARCTTRLRAKSESSKQIMGVAETHVGAFDSSDALVMELRSSGGDLRERRVFKWSGDTLRMTAQFRGDGRTSNHAVTLVRRR